MKLILEVSANEWKSQSVFCGMCKIENNQINLIKQPSIVQFRCFGFRRLPNDRNREFEPVNCQVLTFHFSICIHGTKQPTCFLSRADFGKRF